MTLWRKEEPDSGGPGRHRGGLSGSVAIMPYGTDVPVGLVVASSGKAVSQNNGIAGGYPGNTAIGIIARGAKVRDRFADGEIPDSLVSLDGEHELRPCYEENVVGKDDVLYLHWQGGGGYGDPLLRDPDDVATDLSQGKVTVAGALEGYGVVLVAGDVDESATAQHRDAERTRRRDRSDAVEGAGVVLDVSAGRRLDDNLVEVETETSAVVACVHCGRALGDADSRVLRLARYQGPSHDAGRQVTSAPDLYVDSEVVFRQLSCPNCWTAIYSGIVPAGHPDHALDIGRLLSLSNSIR
jgi:N-methylhydantoinase B